MFNLFLAIKNFFEKTLENNKNTSKNEHLSVLFLIIIIIILFLSKSSSNQGEKIPLTDVLKDYIEEASAFTNTNFQFDSNELFLEETPFAFQEKKNLPKIIFQEAFLPYQSITSIFEKEQRSQIITYVVQEGDTLSQISKDFGISINSLIWANNLKSSDYLTPGQELKIPPVSGVIHLVKNGDTVESIANKYSADKTKIIEFNGLPKDGSLTVGQEIIIPDGKIKIGAQYVKYSSKVRFAYLPDLGDFFISPTKGYNWGRVHGRNGVDIANICGTPIYAASEGTVIAAVDQGWNGGAGKYIKVFHSPEISTLYAHLSKIFVISNQKVVKGQLIGLMGATGQATGCHLHFEVHGAKNPLAKY